MSKCNGDCDNCSDKKGDSGEYVQKHFPFRKNVDVEYFLKPTPKQDQDDTPLDYPCKCDWGKGETKRYMCLPCIKTWIEAVSFDVAMEEADRLEKNGKRVAADRVRETTAEKKWKGPIDADDCIPSRCGNCNCNPTGEDLPSE